MQACLFIPGLKKKERESLPLDLSVLAKALIYAYAQLKYLQLR